MLVCTRASSKYRALTFFCWWKKFLCVFSHLPAVKKDTIFGTARKFFGPKYFVTALAGIKMGNLHQPNNLLSLLAGIENVLLQSIECYTILWIKGIKRCPLEGTLVSSYQTCKSQNLPYWNENAHFGIKIRRRLGK